MNEKNLFDEFLNYLDDLKSLQGKNTRQEAVKSFFEKQKIAKKIRDDLIISFESLPIRIQEKEIIMMEKSRKCEELLLVNKGIEASTSLSVDSLTNTEGKKIFNNEIKRKTEIKKRTNQNKIFTENENRIKIFKKDIREEEIKVGFLKRSFRAAESISRLGV